THSTPSTECFPEEAGSSLAELGLLQKTTNSSPTCRQCRPLQRGRVFDRGEYFLPWANPAGSHSLSRRENVSGGCKEEQGWKHWDESPGVFGGSFTETKIFHDSEWSSKRPAHITGPSFL